MTTGRKNVPTKLKIVRGNPGKRALPKNEPQPKSAGITPPAGLSGYAKVQWKTVSKKLADAGILSEIDTHALQLYCDAAARYHEAQEKLAEQGMLVESPGGILKQSPYLQILNKAFDQMLKIMIEFGMTPASRPKIQVLPEKFTGDEWDSF